MGSIFHIPDKVVLAFFMTLEDHYLKEVPYHNSVHAADVLNSTHVLLNSPALDVSVPNNHDIKQCPSTCKDQRQVS